MASPWRLVLLFGGIVVPLAVAREMADNVLRRETLRLDEPILLWLHARAHPAWDHAFTVVTESGGFLATFAIGLWGAWRLRKARRGRALGFWALSLGGAGAINVFAKLVFARERPALWPTLSPEHDYSFPSGHATLSTALATAVLLLAWPSKWRWHGIVFAALWPPLIGTSRMYLGAHFPSDIVAGACAGLAWTAGVYLILRGQRDRFFRDAAHRAELDEPAGGAQVLAEQAVPLEPIGFEQTAAQKQSEESLEQHAQNAG
jgi:undecaprenyl-diphosphatase